MYRIRLKTTLYCTPAGTLHAGQEFTGRPDGFGYVAVVMGCCGPKVYFHRSTVEFL